VPILPQDILSPDPHHILNLFLVLRPLVRVQTIPLLFLLCEDTTFTVVE
jgi:hypothetical protein